jgi:UDP-glucose 4-epimerase
MNVLVTGGAGYIGSVVVEQLLGDDHQVTVYDNLSKGHAEAIPEGASFIQGDLADRKLLEHTFSRYSIEAVVHMAADSLVGESVTNPSKYYRNNVLGSLSLLDAMQESRVARLVFSSTAAVYGEALSRPLVETDPTEPTNPYGETKLTIERALSWYSNAAALNYVSLRYFNAAGASAKCGEVHHPETHLIPIVLQVAAGVREHIDIYGDDYPTRDGTCVRDYIHVVDLARAHIQALGLLNSSPGLNRIYNLGCGGEGYSVLDVVECARRITGHSIPVRIGPRRAGDPAVLIASSDRIKAELQWAPQFQSLESMIDSAWEWRKSHPNGY